jgi:phosphonate transport system substrate-binding protein
VSVNPVRVLLNTIVVLLAALALAVSGVAESRESAGPYRVGLTPVFLDNQTSFLRDWEEYLERHLDHPVDFLQRQTYREITELLLSGQLDAAWICGYPFVRHRDALRLLAVPLFEGEPLYRSYLIVPAADGETRSVADLKGRVFAYSDPDSNSGFLVPRVELRRQGYDPRRFFARTFFTWSHRDVVSAVADGVAQAGAVDGYVWETLSHTHPELTGATRVAWTSQPFGFPPLVARADLDRERFRRLQGVLLEMPADPEGRRLLQRLNLDGFSPGEEGLFAGIAAAMDRFGEE